MTSRIQLSLAPARSNRRGFLSLLLAANDVWRSRQHLSRLTDAALKDVSLTRNEAETEAERPIWDVPTHWIK